MKVSQTNANYIRRFSPEKMVDIMVEAGFEAIDFGFFDEEYCNAQTDSDEFKERFLNLRKYAEDKGVCFNQAHAPFPSSVEDEAQTEQIFWNIVRAMRNASYLGIKYIVVHPKQHLKYEDEGNPEKLFEMNVEFYKSLIPYCEKYNIYVCVENMWQARNYYGGYLIIDSTCSTPDEFIRYIDTINSKWIVACLDIGHCMLVHQEPDNFIRKLGNRLKALHVHDVDGKSDLHTLPYHGGVINWDKVANALKEINYDGDFTMEVESFLTKNPPELYPSASKMIADTGKYIADKIR